MNKIFFNMFQDQKKEGEFFISHPSNGAKGSASKGVSKAGNPILTFRVEVSGLTLKGVFNKTLPEKMKAGSPQIWGTVEEDGKTYRLAGWWTTAKKSGEPVKSPYFSCSIQEQEPESDADDADFGDIPF